MLILLRLRFTTKKIIFTLKMTAGMSGLYVIHNTTHGFNSEFDTLGLIVLITVEAGRKTILYKKYKLFVSKYIVINKMINIIEAKQTCSNLMTICQKQNSCEMILINKGRTGGNDENVQFT